MYALSLAFVIALFRCRNRHTGSVLLLFGTSLSDRFTRNFTKSRCGAWAVLSHVLVDHARLGQRPDHHKIDSNPYKDGIEHARISPDKPRIHLAPCGRASRTKGELLVRFRPYRVTIFLRMAHR